MARPRLPASQLELRGAFKKDPQRKRVDPVAMGPIGPPPRHLSALERKIWTEIVATSAPGVLAVNHRLQLETLCRLMALERQYGFGGKMGLSNGQLTAKNTLASKFGLTPADTPKLAVPSKKNGGNPFAKFSKNGQQTEESPYAEFDLDPKIN